MPLPPEPEPESEGDFTRFAGTGNPFLERLARGSLVAAPPRAWWRDLLVYDDDGALDFSGSVDDVDGVPQDDVTAAIAILNRHDGEFFYVETGSSGMSGIKGEFRVWNGRTWSRDAHETTAFRWSNELWQALGECVGQLEQHIETTAANRRAELIASGMSEASARQQVTREVIKPMLERVKPIKVYRKRIGQNSGQGALVSRMTRRATIVVDADEFDNEPGLLVVGNGVLDMSDAMERRDPSLVALLPHDPIRRVHMNTTVDYVPSARCPLFMAYLTGVVPDPDVRHYLHKAIGYAMLGRPTEKVVFNLIGPKDSGKSILLKVLSAVMQGYAQSIPPAVLLAKRGSTADPERPQPMLHALRKARFVVASEPDENARWDSGKLKALTGGDEMLTRTLHKEVVPWTAKFSLFIASNQFVKLSVEDKAIVERIAPVEFPNRFLRPRHDRPLDSIPEHMRADVNLEARIVSSQAELEGVLAWMVEGLKLYLVEGLPEPLSVSKRRDDMEKDSSTVIECLEDLIEHGHITVLSDDEAAGRGKGADYPLDQRVGVKEFHEAYIAWCEENHEKFPESWRKIGEKIGYRGSTTGATVKARSGNKVFDRLIWTRGDEGVRGPRRGRFGGWTWEPESED